MKQDAGPGASVILLRVVSLVGMSTSEGKWGKGEAVKMSTRRVDSALNIVLVCYPTCCHSAQGS